MKALDRASSPRSVRLVVRALELTTGWRTDQLLGRKSTVIGTFDTQTVSDWYARNGYRGIAGLGGYGSHAGKSVTPQAAFEVSAFYAICKILAEDVASMPFFLYRRQGNLTEKAFDHPLYGVLHDLTNPETSAGEFHEALTAHAVVTGNGYAKIERRGSTGQVLYLWPLQPEQVRTDRNNANVLFYIVRDGNGPEKTHQAKDIFHLRGFTLDGSLGDDILLRMRHVLGLNMAQQEYAGRFFSQDASPGIIIQRPAGAVPWGTEEIKNVKAAWKEWHAGVSRSHEPAIVQEGATVTRLDPDHQKLQLIEQRKFQLEEIARPLRMPLHRLMHLDRMTFNNVEQLGIDYLTSALEPWRRRWKQAVHRCLLTPEERESGYYAEHSAEIFLRGDFKTQWDGFARGLEKGVYSINDVREKLNLNPVDGGDKHFVQLNMQDVSSAAAGMPPDEEEPAEAVVKRLIESAKGES